MQLRNQTSGLLLGRRSAQTLPRFLLQTGDKTRDDEKDFVSFRCDLNERPRPRLLPQPPRLNLCKKGNFSLVCFHPSTPAKNDFFARVLWIWFFIVFKYSSASHPPSNTVFSCVVFNTHPVENSSSSIVLSKVIKKVTLQQNSSSQVK